MAEQATTPVSAPHALLLSPVQVAFLASLLPGPRPTADCHDAITIGALIRLNLVAWHEWLEHPRRRDRKSTFSLTEAAVQLMSHPADPSLALA